MRFSESNRALRWLTVLAISTSFAGIAGCSSDSGSPGPSPDGGTGGMNDGGTGGMSDGDGGGDNGGRPKPVCLNSSVYRNFLAIDLTFPFCVTQVRAADGNILGSHWGRHVGPMVTTGVYGGASGPKVIQWDVSGNPTLPANSTKRSFATASGIPMTLYYGTDGMVDLPFGSLSLLSYTGSAAHYPGEALLYSSTYDMVTSRARVNGFYSGVGMNVASGPVLVFSGLSPLATDASPTNDNGLYAAPVCNGALAEPLPCVPSWKVLGWRGMSGPVVTDNHGNVFVGASLSDGATSDAVYGLTRAQVVPGKSATAATITAQNTMGTSSIAAVAPEGAAPGWVLGLGFDPSNGVYAASFTESGSTLAAGGTIVYPALRTGASVDGLSVFSDTNGNFWVAVTNGPSGAYLELRRNP